MMVPALLSWVFTALLLVLALVSIAAGRGAIPLNRVVGIRFPAVMRGQAQWRAGHAAAVLPAVVACGCAFVFAFLGGFVPALYWGSVAAFVLGLIWVVVRATRAAAAVGGPVVETR